MLVNRHIDRVLYIARIRIAAYLEQVREAHNHETDLSFPGSNVTERTAAAKVILNLNKVSNAADPRERWRARAMRTMNALEPRER